jgi:hypothetical protein
MLFESRNRKQNSFVFEKWRISFDCLHRIRARGVDEFANAIQYRPRKIGGLGDVGVNARIFP